MENKEKTARVEYEGGGSSWWYVCEECHTTIGTKDKVCPTCKRRLIWNENRNN